MREIKTLAGLPADGARRLQKTGVETLDDLWSRLGSKNSEDEFKLQLTSLALVSRLPPARLLSVLADEVVNEVRWGDYARLSKSGLSGLARWLQSLLSDLWLELREVLKQSPRVFLGRQWLDVTLGTLLVLSCWFFLTHRLVPVLLAERPAVLIARHDLAEGEALDRDDWVEKRWLPASSNRLVASTNPVTWKTTRKIYGGQPLRYADFKRQQVVAVRDLAAGETLIQGSVELVLSRADPQGLTTPDGLLGKRVRQKILAGAVITEDLLDAQLPRVVASGWLPAFRILGPQDVTGDPPGASTEELVQKVQGRLILHDLAAGEPVEDALLSLPFAASDLVERRVTALDGVASGLELRAGSRVSLWVTPSEDKAAAFGIEDVLVLRAAGEKPALVALTAQEFTDLVPWLGRSRIAVYRTVLAP